MPTCPICGGELAYDEDDREYHFESYIYCKNDSDHITVGVDITKAEYEKLKETYFRIQNLDDVYVVDNGNDLIRARWKRRNREAQLKRTIARLRRIERRKLRQDKLLQLYRARVTLLKCDLNTLAIEKEQQESYNITLCKQQQRLYSILRVYTRGCFGHDIEGS